jgi:hypothetical protein
MGGYLNSSRERLPTAWAMRRPGSCSRFLRRIGRGLSFCALPPPAPPPARASAPGLGLLRFSRPSTAKGFHRPLSFSTGCRSLRLRFCTCAGGGRGLLPGCGSHLAGSAAGLPWRLSVRGLLNRGRGGAICLNWPLSCGDIHARHGRCENRGGPDGNLTKRMKSFQCLLSVRLFRTRAMTSFSARRRPTSGSDPLIGILRSANALRQDATPGAPRGFSSVSPIDHAGSRSSISLRHGQTPEL